MFKFFNRLREIILKKIYKTLIFKTIVLDKSNLGHYDKLATFCALDVETDKGVFTFLFKEDRRKSKRNTTMIPSIASYIIELIIPDNLLPIEKTVKEKIVIVVKVMLFKVDYKLLTQVLTDMYLDTILGHIQSRKT